jgi:hypothetical protein
VPTDDSDPFDNDTTSEVGEPPDSSPSYPVDKDPPSDPTGSRFTRRYPAGGSLVGGGPTENVGLGSLASSASDYDYDGPIGGAAGGSNVFHPVTGQALRAFLTLGLTAAVVAVVLIAMITHLPPADFAQYVSPLTGFAGLALGYWFGTEKNN